MNNLYVIFGLIPDKTANIAKLIADRKDLYYLSVNDLIEYEFSKVVFDYEICNHDYYQTKIKKLVLGIFDYENSLISIDVDNLLNENVLEVAKNKSKLIFINFTKGDKVPIVNNLIFDELQTQCIEHADLVVEETFEVDILKQIESYIDKHSL